MKKEQKSDNPLPGRSRSLIEKPNKEKCYGNRNRNGGVS